MKKKLISLAAAAVMMTNTFASIMPSAAVTAQAASPIVRSLEKLDRGLIVMNKGGAMYLSWRLLGTEPYTTTFNVYRDGVLIANVSDSTNYVDAKGNSESLYSIAPVTGGIEGELSSPAKQWAGESNYLDVDIDIPAGGNMIKSGSTYVDYTYTINDMSTGDLDGDGQYELLVKFMPTNAGESLPATYTASVLFGAYELDGTPLWTDANGKAKYIDLGLNIRANPHGTQFIVYDLNGDGVAEIATKTAQGTIDTAGNMLLETNTAADDYYKVVKSSDYSKTDLSDRVNSKLSHVGTNGQVLCGREYYTAFDGRTGEFIDTVLYHTPRTFEYYNNDSANNKTEQNYLWGDNFGNRVERFTSTVAYLDGKTPYAVEWRGYYHGNGNPFGRTAVGAYTLSGKELKCAYTFDTAGSVYEKFKKGDLKWGDIFSSETNAKNQLITNNTDYAYCGNGNHNIVAADFDDDGYDEVASGSLCLKLKDGKLGVKWNYGMGHGDAFHTGRMVKGGHNLYFIVHEDNTFGMTVIDPYNDGEKLANGVVGKPTVLFYEKAGSDTGRGIMVKGTKDYFVIDSSGNDYRKVTYNASTPNDTDDSDGSVTKNGYTFAKVENPDYSPAAESPGPKYIANFNSVGSGGGVSYNSRVYWDSDVYDELLDGFGAIDKDGNFREGSLFTGNYSKSGDSWYRDVTLEGTYSNNSTKNNPCLSADIIGDWREEIIGRRADGKGFRIYVSDIPTTNKVYTLMHDSQYRSGVAAEQAAYNQPPHVSWYMGEDMDMAADKPNITTTAVTANVTPVSTKDPVRTYSDTAAVIKESKPDEKTSTTITLNDRYIGKISLYAEVKASGNTSLILQDSSKNYAGNIDFADGLLYTNADLNNKKPSSGAYESNKWYSVDFNIDVTGKTMTMTVADIETGIVVLSKSVGFRHTDTANINKIILDTNCNLRNCVVYTGDAPCKGTITVPYFVMAGGKFTPTVAWSTVGGVAPTSWVSNDKVSYTLYKDGLMNPLSEAITVSNGEITVSDKLEPGEYMLEAYDNIKGYAYAKLSVKSSNATVTDGDVSIELNAISGADLTSKIYTDAEMKNEIDKSKLGISSSSTLLSVLATISSSCAAANYEISAYKIDISKNGQSIASVVPTVFKNNNNICMSQFINKTINEGIYDVKVTFTIKQNDKTYDVSASKQIDLTPQQPTGLREYYYVANNSVVSVFVK